MESLALVLVHGLNCTFIPKKIVGACTSFLKGDAALQARGDDALSLSLWFKVPFILTNPCCCDSVKDSSPSPSLPQLLPRCAAKSELQHEVLRKEEKADLAQRCVVGKPIVRLVSRLMDQMG